MYLSGTHSVVVWVIGYWYYTNYSRENQITWFLELGLSEFGDTECQAFRLESVSGLTVLHFCTHYSQAATTERHPKRVSTFFAVKKAQNQAVTVLNCFQRYSCPRYTHEEY